MSSPLAVVVPSSCMGIFGTVVPCLCHFNNGSQHAMQLALLGLVFWHMKSVLWANACPLLKLKAFCTSLLFVCDLGTTAQNARLHFNEQVVWPWLTMPGESMSNSQK